jgi:hypothetical protein
MLKSLLLLLCFPIAGYAQHSSQGTAPEASAITTADWKTLSAANYSIQYPADWELNQSGIMGTSFILFAPVTGPKDVFRENVNLMIQDVSAYNMDLDDFAKLSEEQIATMLTNAKIIENKRMGTGAAAYQRLEYTADQGQNHLRFIQYYWVVEKQKAYVLTFTGAQDQFAAFAAMGERIMRSFVIKG